MTNKYELTGETVKLPNGETGYRIRALKDFADVKAGNLGGFVQSEKNLSQDGNAWVSGNARVSDNAQVCGDARVSGDARVFENARVSGNAWVFENAQVYGDAQVFENAWVYGDARVLSRNDILFITGLGS